MNRVGLILGLLFVSVSLAWAEDPCAGNVSCQSSLGSAITSAGTSYVGAKQMYVAVETEAVQAVGDPEWIVSPLLAEVMELEKEYLAEEEGQDYVDALVQDEVLSHVLERFNSGN